MKDAYNRRFDRLHARQHELQECLAEVRIDPGTSSTLAQSLETELQRVRHALERHLLGMGSICECCGEKIGAARHALMIDATECAWCASRNRRPDASACGGSSRTLQQAA